MDIKQSDKASGEHEEFVDSEKMKSPKAQDEYAEAYVPDTEEERKLVRKIDLYILPTMWIMYLLSYMDRTNQYMTIPIYVCAFVVTIVVVYYMDKYPRWRGLVLGCAMGVACLCSIITCAVYDFKARYTLLVIMASGLWASNGLSLAYASSTFTTMTAEVRGISLAFVNAMGNLAQIYGSYLFPSKDSPKYLMGFGVISGLCFTGVVAYLGLFVLLKRPSARR
ncbi:vitamin H transporter [Apiospora phragmitis]|uniref:Vitamin H transporter n=1 Tax=Apiospora phragmitis TaxID=2905665 RepID=A0ABR1U725_9PEZI